MVNKNTIDDCIWKIQKILMEKYGCTAADREIAPLIWYINTGRASTPFLKKLIDAKPFMIARKLVTHGRIRCGNHRQDKGIYRITDRHSIGVPFFLRKIRSWRIVWKPSKSYHKFICKKCKKMLALVIWLWYHCINNKANTLYKHNTFLIGGKTR